MSIPIATHSSYIVRFATAKRVLSMVDHVLSRHRVCFFIYLAVFVKLWNLDFMKEPSPKRVLKTTMDDNVLRDAETSVTPLVRNGIYSVAEAHSGAAKLGNVSQKRRKILFATVGDVEGIIGMEKVTDAARILKRALTGGGAVMQGQELTGAYTTLANMYSARGQYTEAVDAMNRAAQSAVDANDRARTQAAFVLLELKHQRYEAATVRFTAALESGTVILDPGLRATVIVGIGWAELMRGKLEEAYSHFRNLLKETNIHTDSPELFTQAACQARGNVLDGCNAEAMAGLSVVFAQQGRNTTNGTSPSPAEVAECAASFLVGAVDDAFGVGHCRVQLARRRLGQAYFALGQTRKARQQYQKVLQLELKSSHAWPAIGTPKSPVGSPMNFCSLADLTRCSDKELYAALFSDRASPDDLWFHARELSS